MSYCKKVWLIDDDELSNYLTAHTIQINHFSSDVQFYTNAIEALAEINSLLEKNKKVPDFIFLDLNMPEVDGWEFLKTYRELPKEVKDNCNVYILSSSINVEDINKSKLHEDVQDFFSKPITKRDLSIIKFQAKKSQFY